MLGRTKAPLQFLRLRAQPRRRHLHPHILQPPDEGGRALKAELPHRVRLNECVQVVFTKDTGPLHQS